MIFASATTGAASMTGKACTTKVPGPTEANMGYLSNTTMAG